MTRSHTLDSATRERVIESSRRFALRFSGAVNSLKTYPSDHASLQFSYRGVAGALTEVYELTGPVDLSMQSDAVVIGQLRADLDASEHPHLRELSTWLRRRDIAVIHLADVVTAEQVRLLVEAAIDVGEQTPTEARTAINIRLCATGCGHIQLSGHRTRGGVATQSADPAQRLLELYLELGVLAGDLEANGARSGTVSGLMRTCEELVGELAACVQVVPALVSLGQRMPYAIRHGANTVVLAVGIGARLGLSQRTLADLAQAVATMDSGMGVLPPDVRHAGRQLGAPEWSTLRTHPLESFRAALRERELSDSVRRRLVVALEHHLGVDRSGYPQLRLWPHLHLFSRIAAVVDAYDAITSTTAWRHARPPEQALAELLPPLGRAHDPVIVAELCALLMCFPRYCGVRLSTGQLAVILPQRGATGLPLVRLGSGLDEGQQIDLGQRDDAGHLTRTVVEVLTGQDAPGGS